MSGRGWFGKKTPTPRETGATEAIRTWAKLHGGLSDETVIAVNEIVCSDIACPGTETVLLIMTPGRKTKALKIAKALIDVTESDLVSAINAASAGPLSGA